MSCWVWTLFLLLAWGRPWKHATLSTQLHISRGPSDVNQNGTQEKAQFWRAHFFALSYGVVCFALTFSFYNHWIETPHRLLKNFDYLAESSFWTNTCKRTWTTPRERVWQTTMPENSKTPGSSVAIWILWNIGWPDTDFQFVISLEPQNQEKVCKWHLVKITSTNLRFLI